MHNLQHLVVTIILAAGAGKRMGQSKWNLQIAGKTFLEHIVTTLHSSHIHEIICVVSNDSYPPPREDITCVVNNNPKSSMFSSIYCGVYSRPHASGYIIFPVDHPLVTSATVQKLTQVFHNNPDKVICPTFNGHSGHPLIVPGKALQHMENEDYPGGLREFLRKQQALIYKTEVDDKNILRNINTKEDIMGSGLES